MDWSNEPYVRVYTRETDDDLVLSWEARAIWDRLLTKFDRSGFFETKRGAKGIAAATRIPFAVVERCLSELLEDGRMVEVEGGYCAPNYVDAQTATKTDRQRQRDSRDRRRLQKLDQPVTERDESVTSRDESVTNVTLTSALLCSADPLRGSAGHQPPDSPEPRLSRSPESSADPDQIKARRRLVSWGLDELNRIRARVAKKFGWTDVQPVPLQGRIETDLLQRLREAGDQAEPKLRHVLRIAEIEAVSKQTVEYLGGGIFGDASWSKKVTMREADAKRSIGGPANNPPRTQRIKTPAADDDMPPLPPEATR